MILSRLHYVCFSLMLMAGALLGAQDSWANIAKCKASTNVGKSLNGYNITSGFGARDSFKTSTGKASSFHRGIDLSVRGKPNVGSFTGGTVNTGSGSKGYGNWVSVTSGNFQVFYAHAGSVSVKNGQTVSAGDTLGNWATCSGSCTGPHIHLEYRVKNSAGEWVKVDPIAAQALLDSGMQPNDPAFAQAALKATTDGCNISADALKGGASAGGIPNEVDEICDPGIKSQIITYTDAVTAFRQSAMQQVITPPPAPSMVANTPCVSKSLQNVTDQFSNMPKQYIQQKTGSLLYPTKISASNILNQFFQAGILSLNNASQILPKMMDFQGLASDALGGMLSSLGVSSAFSDELCGMMADVVVNYLQCQFPINIPSFGSLGSLNDLLPSNCAGNAARDALYLSSEKIPALSQPIFIRP